MVIKICYFTKKGEELVHKLLNRCKARENEANCERWDALSNIIPLIREREEDLYLWVEDAFDKRLPMLFVGATGIAVRAIAPFVRDKRKDPPVVVMDERGSFVIPLLSGHLGGANELAAGLAGLMGAQAVITTGTDVEGLFSVDVFAVRNGLHIGNREGIQRVSSKILAGEKALVAVSPRIRVPDIEIPGELSLVPFESPGADIEILTERDIAEGLGKKGSLITLIAKEYVLGIGCKKGKSFEELRSFAESACRERDIDPERQVCAIASIDIKRDEAGLCTLAQFYRVPFYTFGERELLEVPGSFSDSAFVEETVGVGNVCERSALALGGAFGGELILKKTAFNGMTLAISKITPEIKSFGTGI